MGARKAIATALLLLLAQPVSARNGTSTLELAPTMLQLRPGEAGLFYLANRSASPVTIQLDAFDWSQTPDGDRLTPGNTLFASPPFATIAPGARQTVRVLATPTDRSRESEYRLVISQLPGPGESGAAGVHILLQFNIPVFVAAGRPAPPQVAWDAIRTGHHLSVIAQNTGARTVKIQDLRIFQNGQSETPAFWRLGYILPAAAQEWQLDSASATPIHIEARDGLSGAAITADVTPHG